MVANDGPDERILKERKSLLHMNNFFEWCFGRNLVKGLTFKG